MNGQPQIRTALFGSLLQNVSEWGCSLRAVTGKRRGGGERDRKVFVCF